MRRSATLPAILALVVFASGIGHAYRLCAVASHEVQAAAAPCGAATVAAHDGAHDANGVAHAASHHASHGEMPATPAAPGHESACCDAGVAFAALPTLKSSGAIADAALAHALAPALVRAAWLDGSGDSLAPAPRDGPTSPYAVPVFLSRRALLL
jgi:hypothetical protein